MFTFMQNSYLSLTSFLKYYKHIANLSFWVLWQCLVMSTIINSTTLQETLMFIRKQKINLIPQFFLEILHFKKNPAIWLFKNILVDNYRKNLLPDIGFAMEIQELKELSFCIVYTKIKCQNFHKKKINKSKMPYFCTHCQNLGKT